MQIRLTKDVAGTVDHTLTKGRILTVTKKTDNGYWCDDHGKQVFVTKYECVEV